MNNKITNETVIATNVIAETIENISRKINNTLIKNLNDWGLTVAVSIFAYIGSESSEVQNLLKTFDSNQQKELTESIKKYKENPKFLNALIELFLSYSNISFNKEFLIIKENLLWLDIESRKKTLALFHEKVPVFQKQFDNFLFNFEDIKNINDRAIQIMLNYSDQQILIKALKGTSEEVKYKIFRNMSNLTANMIKEDMKYMGTITISEVEQAQTSILHLFLRLEKEGKLKINSLNPSDLIH